MKWSGKTAGLAAVLAVLAVLAGQAGALPPAQSVSLTLPPNAFKLQPTSVRTQLGAVVASPPQDSVSINLDLRPLPRKPVARLSPQAMFVVAVASRLRQALTPELAENFDLFLYVSKASRGPYAQHMYVFRRRTRGDLDLVHDWPVSTGRERVEKNAFGRRAFTVTPPGYYELDPARLYADYYSEAWDGPMAHAMFFDAWRKGARVGLAIHAAHDEGIDRLGSRASAGCVRLSPANARALFKLVKDEYRGDVPRLAYDPQTQSTRRDGVLMRDVRGRLQFKKGYRVLVIVEDFGGDQIAMQ